METKLPAIDPVDTEEAVDVSAEVGAKTATDADNSPSTETPVAASVAGKIFGDRDVADKKPTTSGGAGSHFIQSNTTFIKYAAILAVLVGAGFGSSRLIFSCVFALDKDEQLFVQRLTNTEVINGPGLFFISPLVKNAVRRKAELLKPLDYLHVKDQLNGELSLVKGPKLHFLKPFDEVVKRGDAYSLTQQEYIVCKDTRTGVKRVEKGPNTYVPGAYEECTRKNTAISLESTQYLRLRDKNDGKRWVVRGPSLIVPEPSWELIAGGPEEAMPLKKTEYVRLVDEMTGEIRVLRGEQIVFPEATETILESDGGKMTAINLKVFQYVKIVDDATGVIRVVRGEATVFLGPTESLVRPKGKGGGAGYVQDAVAIDTETAVQVRSKRTGELILISKETKEASDAELSAGGLFFPKAEEEIVEVQNLIKLADYECMIVKNAAGELNFYYGAGEKRDANKPRAFFIPPHHSIYSLTWSRGRRREKRDLNIDRLDLRPQFMSFEFNTRTSDNVELVLEGTFFWQIENVETMVKMTGDTTGDISQHARSKFIQRVSQVTLKDFMDNFNALATEAQGQEDDEFYTKRGVRIHSLEVTAYRCQDASTARILEQIIQETTNRMNRLSQQESENEIKMFALTGEIEQETRRADLLKVLQNHKLMEAQNEGEAEAERVKAFLTATEGAVTNLDTRVGLWNVLRKQDALKAVSSGPARLYFTPSDVNLSIETKEAGLTESSTGSDL